MTDKEVALALLKLALENRVTQAKHDTPEKLLELYRQCLEAVNKPSSQE